MRHALSLLLLLPLAAMADDAAILKCRALPDAGSRLACYDAMPLGAAPEHSFGLAPAVQTKKDAQADTIRSTVAGEIGGWSPGTRIALANGQVWRVVEGEAVLPMLSHPKAEVSRGLLNGYFLQIDGYNSAARVKRVQ